MSSTTKSTRNLLFLLIAKNTEIDGSGSNYEDKIIEKLLFKNLNKTIDYLTFNAKKIFI